MRKGTAVRAAFSAALLIGLVGALPASIAGAAGPPSTVWVRASGGALQLGGGTSCAKPGFRSVQAGINGVAVGGSVEVCAGTYVQQLRIHKSISLVGNGESSTTVKLPASPANSAGDRCDNAVNTAYGTGGQVQDGVSICDAGSVAIRNLTVEPQWPSGTCNDNLYGILVLGRSDLTASHLKVDGGGAFPVNGCQGGVAVQIGLFGLTPASVGIGAASLTDVAVSNYQKNGITVDGHGTTATITSTDVTTQPTTATAQNGIQISNGAKATMTSVHVSGNECNEPKECGATGTYEAGGVLIYDAAPGTSLTHSTVSDNDYGVYYISGAATEAASRTTTISNDHFTGNRFQGMLVDQGILTLSSDIISATQSADPDAVGILVYQYSGQNYASQATASGLDIYGQYVGVELSTDNVATDHPGTFTINNSLLRGNYGASTDPLLGVAENGFTIKGTNDTL